jgi:hypothetical protein
MASVKGSRANAMAALIACKRLSFPSPPFPGAYQNEKVRPSPTEWFPEKD